MFDGDSIIIGKHSLNFVDLRPEEERPSKAEESQDDGLAGRAFRDTVILDTQAQQDLLAKQAEERGFSQDELPEKPKKIELYGSITLISGGTPQIIDLTKRLTTLGKASDSDVKCSGLLVGKTAALINKRPNGFFLAYGRAEETGSQRKGSNHTHKSGRGDPMEALDI
jgi:hypothetical protein